MNNKLEYVLSGTGFMRLHTKGLLTDTSDFVNNCLTKMNSAFSDQQISFLYNAYTESDLGRHLAETYKDSMPNLYGDSGGLQVITRGKQVTEEIKLGVYKNQASYASRGFIFDEIPISFTGTKSSRLDISTRWYNMDVVEEKAKQTGRNVAKQIETFLDMKSDCLPVFIVQGNCIETANIWVKNALAEIPKSHHKYITCAAQSFSSAGFGNKEDILRAQIFTQLPFDLQHIHLLGVGALSRLVPTIIYMQNGTYKNLHISYDSTSHSGGPTNGRTFIGNKDYKFPRQLDKTKWPTIFNSIQDKFNMPLTIQEFHDLVNSGTKAIDENYGSRDKQVIALSALVLNAVAEFMGSVEKVLHDKKALMKLITNKKQANIFESLYEVKSSEDYKYWESHIGRFVDSKPISKSPPNNIFDFFEND